MIETLLSLWLANGAFVQREISATDCDRHIAAAEMARDNGGIVEFHSEDMTAVVVRLACGERDVVLALPPATGNCEYGEPTT